MSKDGLNNRSFGACGDVLFFVGVAALFRVGFMLAMPRVVDSADAVRYIGLARDFLVGDFGNYRTTLPILYPFLCSIVHHVAPDVEFACRIVSLMSSVLLVVPVYLLCRDIHGTRSARISVLIVSIWPWLADYGCRIGPDSLASLLWFASIWLFYRMLRDGGFSYVAAPLCFFLLHLARPEGTFLMASAPLAGFILFAGKDNRKLLRIVPFILVCVLLAFCYSKLTSSLFGKVPVAYRVPSADTLGAFLGRRGLEIPRTFSALGTEALPVMLGPLLLLFAGAGLFQGDTQKRRIRLELYVLFFAAAQFCLAVLSTYPEPRYLISTVVALSLWSARGIEICEEKAVGLKFGRALRCLPGLSVVTLMVFNLGMTVAPDYMGRMPREPREYKIAGLWMKENLEPGLIIVRKPQIGFYAEMPTLGPAYEDDAMGVIARSKKNGAKYLVVDERYTAKIVPGLSPLLEPANAPPGLRLLSANLSPYEGGRIVIYEIEQPADPGQD